MARSRLCRSCGEWHQFDAWPRECIAEPAVRSPLPAPNIRPDGMDALQSMASGKMFDSKSAYYADVKAHGCEIVGDDRDGFGRPKTTDDLIPPNIGGDIKAAIEQLST